MKQSKSRRILVAVLLLIFFGSSGMLAHRLIQYQEGNEVYAEAQELVELPDLAQVTPTIEDDASYSSSTDTTIYVDPYAEALQNMDFTALQKVNDDVLGWIIIPNTRLSYPLLQGEDNDYYLDHTWRKYWNSVGAIFMECKCSSDLSDFNTIIYGHRMNNRSMFGILLNYDSQSYWREHPRVYITDDNGTHIYDIFAAYEAEVGSPTYLINLTNETDKQAFIDFCVEHSLLQTGIIPTVEDQILTLSTCTGNGHATRWVVQCAKVKS